MDQFLRGAIVAGCLAAGLFFLRFFRRSQDRLFLFFALSFFLLAAERFMLAVLEYYDPTGAVQNAARAFPYWVRAFPYWVRAFAYLLIIAGIVDKNLARRQEAPAK